MRVGLICPYSLSVPGGVQGQVLGLARELRRRGHEIRILAPTDGPPPDPDVTPLGPSVLNPSNGSMAPLAPDPSAQLRTIRALWDEAFDVVHIHEPFCPGPTVTAVLMKSAPLVGTFHAAGEQPAYRYLAWLARTMGKRLDARVAVSEAAKAMIEPTIGGEWNIFFNGVEVDRFASAVPWERPEGRQVVLFVGRHEDRKGLSVLLGAVRHLRDDVVVWVAGDGPQTEELRAQYRHEERIEWLGRVSDDERDRRMAAADVFCAPSIGGESFGVILLEAMAAGAPVVAGDIDGYRGVAGPLDGRPRAAILSPPGASAALGDALRSVLDDPILASELRAEGRRRADRFSMSALADAYLELYSAVSGVSVP